MDNDKKEWVVEFDDPCVEDLGWAMAEADAKRDAFRASLLGRVVWGVLKFFGVQPD